MKKLLSSQSTAIEIFTTISDGLITLDTGWVCTYVNKKAKSIIDRKQTDIIGVSLSVLLPHLWNNAAFQASLSSLKKNHSTSIEYFHIPQNVWYLVKVYTVNEGFVLYMNDVSFEKNEDFNRQYYSQIMLHVSDAVISTDKEYNIQTWNKAAEKMYGWKMKEVIGKKANEIIPTTYAPEVNRADVMAAIAKKKHWRGEVKQKRRDGVVLDVYASLSGITDSDGEIIGYVTINHNITLKKRTEQTIRRFHFMADNAKTSLAFLDKDGTFLYANKITYKQLGYSKTEFLKRKLYEFSPDISPKDYTKIFSEAQKTEKKPFETLLKHKNGTLLPVEISLTGVTLEDTDYIFVVIQDIRERKKGQEAMKESEERFRSMADNAPVLIWMSGTDKLCTYFNKTWLEFRGRSLKQEIGNGWMDGIHPEDLDRYLNMYTTSFDKRIPYRMEYRLQRYDGTYRWVLDDAVPRFSPNGTFAGFIGTCIDITPQKALEQRKDEFISLASHELKTPVTTIKAFSQLLDVYFRNIHDEKATTYLGKMNNQLNKLTKLIDELLDVSRIQAGKFMLNKERVDLFEVVTETVEDIQAIARNHTIVLRKSVKASVLADKYRISQVITNLLTNAIKYSPANSSIFVDMYDSGDTIKVSVIDAGIGISKEEQKNIFKRFYRISSVDNNSFPGLGLGLHIAKEIVDRHAGSMGVISQEKKGSEFYFILPKV